MEEIALKIARNGGYDPCERFPKNDKFWTKINACDFGFVPDYESGYCYKVLFIQENFDDAESSCASQHDAELLLFDTDFEVQSFINLFKTGNFFKFVWKTHKSTRPVFVLYKTSFVNLEFYFELT